MATGLPQPEDSVAGLYAVYGRGALLYIGKSADLNRRLGQFVGAAVGGWWLHSGGNTLFHRRVTGELALALADLTFEAWIGDDAYAAEGQAIGVCKPPVNGTTGEVELMALDLRGIRLDELFQVEAEARARLETLVGLLDRLIAGVDRTPYPAESDWNLNGWRGVGRRVGNRWRNTVYAGFAIRDGVVRVGLWAYEGDTLWFGAEAEESVASTVVELVHLMESWRRAWLA